MLSYFNSISETKLIDIEFKWIALLDLLWKSLMTTKVSFKLNKFVALMLFKLDSPVRMYCVLCFKMIKMNSLLFWHLSNSFFMIFNLTDKSSNVFCMITFLVHISWYLSKMVPFTTEFVQSICLRRFIFDVAIVWRYDSSCVIFDWMESLTTCRDAESHFDSVKK